MENSLLISANGPWYELFYNFAFLIGLMVLLLEAYKRKIPIMKWVILIIITRIFFIAGTKVITFGFDEWNELFTRYRMPQAQGRSLLGGLLFGLAGFLSGFYLLRFRHNIADAFAVALPLGIAIQRFGCFLTGCCFGKPCSLPWAVQYPVNTLPHFHQFNESLLSHHDLVSLSVHPVQLYEAGGMMAAILLLLHFRNRLYKSGSLLILSFLLMLAVRFASEFFRDINAHVIGGSMMGAFNITQLVLLPGVLILLIWLVLRERLPVQTARLVKTDLSPHHTFFWLLLLFMFFLTIRQWLDVSERAVMLLTFLIAFAFPVYHMVNLFIRKPYKWVCLAGFILPFFLLSQTYKENARDSILVKKYKTLKLGLGSGDLINSHEFHSGEGCDSYSNIQYFQQEYKLAAAAFEISEEKPFEIKKFTYGAKVVVGHQQETRLSDTNIKDFNLVDVSPYVNYESKWVGVGAGLHLGNLNYVTEDLSEERGGMASSGNKSPVIYPRIYLRLGHSKWFFADYHLADHFPSALPGFRQQLGIGTGLGLSDFTSLRVGSNLGSMTYLSGSFPFKRITLEPTLLWGEAPYFIDDTHYQFSLGLSYRFGIREELKAEPVKFGVKY